MSDSTKREPKAYQPETILTTEEVAGKLSSGEPSVLRHKPSPSHALLS